ncbi:chromate transporter [Malikia granosa]|uniref:Chromate transporter n=1 Tax=Malikia granosa TaxID=263067 RepID=A0A2S9K3F1_9BURK|nr:chromate transporter [Malikia granosa]PRD64983.1 chromate transporter [Malikia granosa]
MSLADWLQLLLFHLSLSLLAVGGAITLAPDLHRWLVSEQGWLNEAQFTQSMALAQAAPGPNVLFVALMGWNVGFQAAAPAAAPWLATLLGAAGALVCLLGIMTPSSILTLIATRWCQKHRERLGVQAFRQGLAPIVVGLLLATSWLLGRSGGQVAQDGRLWLLTLACTLLVWRTRLHMLWLLAAGALLGIMGWV